MGEGAGALGSGALVLLLLGHGQTNVIGLLSDILVKEIDYL